jgi:hypothetical protein
MLYNVLHSFCADWYAIVLSDLCLRNICVVKAHAVFGQICIYCISSNDTFIYAPWEILIPNAFITSALIVCGSSWITNTDSFYIIMVHDVRVNYNVKDDWSLI